MKKINRNEFMQFFENWIKGRNDKDILDLSDSTVTLCRMIIDFINYLQANKFGIRKNVDDFIDILNDVIISINNLGYEIMTKKLKDDNHKGC